MAGLQRQQISTSNNQQPDIDLAGSKTTISPKVKRLGVTLDSSLTFTAHIHISNICQKFISISALFATLESA